MTYVLYHLKSQSEHQTENWNQHSMKERQLEENR